MQLAKALHLRKMLDWAPLIVSSALGGDYLHLALIIATAITAFNIFLDAVFRKFGVIKVIAMIIHSQMEKLLL